MEASQLDLLAAAETLHDQFCPSIAVVVGGAETSYLFVLLVIYRANSMLLRAASIHICTNIHPSVSQSGCYMKHDIFFLFCSNDIIII